MRDITINIREVLDLVSCAEDYGFAKQILISAFAEMLEHKLTYEEIEIFAREIEAGDGYSEEDYDQIKERLTEFKNKYCKEAETDAS